MDRCRPAGADRWQKGRLTMRVLIFGAGFSGRRFAELIGPHAAVAGTTRSADKAGALRALGVEPFVFDGASLSPALAAELEQATHLVISIAPGEDGDPVLRQANDLIRGAPKLRWIGYLSTVGVYGNHDGAWIDEETPCRPVSKRSLQRRAAEDAWLELGRETGTPVALLRLSGIYGPGRNALVNLAAGRARRLVKPGQVFNRIHVDDIAGALRLLASGAEAGIFNVTDDEPAPPQDVVGYAAGLMSVAPPPETAFEDAELSPMARSFYGENKRVSNARIKREGLVFRYPNYRIALDAMWRDGTWGGV
jgi:nucleoside-diphosphate-sugar epimerase